jgi:hypothetical protein
MRLTAVTPTGVLSVLAIAGPLAQLYSPPSIVPLLAIGCLILLLLRRPGRIMRSLQSFYWLIAVFAGIVLYGAGSSLWAINPVWSLTVAGRLSGLFLCGIILLEAALSLEDADRVRFGRNLLIGFGLDLVNIELNLLSGGDPILWLQAMLKPFLTVPQRPVIMPVRVDTSMTLVGLLMWPCLTAVSGKSGRALGVALYAAGLAIIFQGASTTAMITTLAGGFLFACGWFLPRLTCWLLGAAALFWTLLAPLILRLEVTGLLSPLTGSKSGSWEHRRRVWDFVIGRIRERPLAGWGLGDSRFLPGGRAEIAPGVAMLPLHPHDAALQLWLELGGLGAILGACFLLGLFLTIDRHIADRRQRALALALAAASFLHAMVSFSLWHEWWLGFLILSAGFFLAAAPSRPRF